MIRKNSRYKLVRIEAKNSMVDSNIRRQRRS